MPLKVSHLHGILLEKESKKIVDKLVSKYHWGSHQKEISHSKLENLRTVYKEPYDRQNNVSHQDIHVLIPRFSECVTLHDKRDFENVKMWLSQGL